MIHFNDNKTSAGIEANYYEDIETLYIYPTNHKKDWKENFTGWLFPKYIKGYGLVNRKWWNEALWLYKEVSKSLEVKRAGGYSKGGAQAQYFALLRETEEVFSIAGFPARPLGKLKGKLYRKKGDIVPLFSGHRYEEYTKIGPWQWFTKAHRWYAHERHNIIYNKEL